MERRRWDDPDVAKFLRTGTPVVLTDVPLTRKLVGKWSFDYLAENYGGPPGLNVHFAPRHTTRFSRFYGDGAGEGGILGLTFQRFVEVVRTNEGAPRPPWRHYMQSTLLMGRGRMSCGKQDKAAEIGGSLQAGPDTVDHAKFSRRIASDLTELDFEWLERMCEAGGCGGLGEVNLWAGASGGCTPLHFDETSNFLCQLTGRKRLLLFSPGQAAKVYPYPKSHPAHFFGMIDVEKPDLRRFPSLERAKGLECLLEPGDCLWLPSYVWHYVKQVEGDETLSLNFWVGNRADSRRNRVLAAETAGRGIDAVTAAEVRAAALSAAKHAERRFAAGGLGGLGAAGSGLGGRLQEDQDADEDDELLEGDEDAGLISLQMARHVEGEAVNALCGNVPHSGKFLTALSLGADSRWPPDSPGAQMAAQFRAHLIAVLGAARGNALLRGLARDGRLDPGLAPPLEADKVVGTECGPAFTSREALRRLVRENQDGGDLELRKRALL